MRGVVVTLTDHLLDKVKVMYNTLVMASSNLKSYVLFGAI
jgi:hypothetical protein